MIYLFIQHMQRHFDNIGEAIQQPKPWLIITAVFSIINQYIFSQWNFAIAFFIVFLIDTGGGAYTAWRTKKFSIKLFRDKLMDKSVAYFCIIIGYSVCTKMVLEGKSTNVIEYLDIPFYSLFVTAELFSIIRNWYRYKKWPVLLKIMSHFEGFDSETGKEKGNE
ncbi:hypothetical protein DN752_21115 [Echinicola strongylocentroti]|uniref:Holin n=1 Tax=Echinicola strongylocentroti TaxID=1795355 RepID=A0A2Z4INM4_9BACT|nr:phage holin family protein [Echinicola strongylocentroti]AWW32444.1 hypothetical protein DN752_21115 [Echinicola strongylocentroti]